MGYEATEECTRVAYMHLRVAKWQYKIDMRFFRLRILDVRRGISRSYRVRQLLFAKTGSFARFWFYFLQKWPKLSIFHGPAKRQCVKPKPTPFLFSFRWCLQAKASLRRLFILLRLFTGRWAHFYSPLISCDANSLKPWCRVFAGCACFGAENNFHDDCNCIRFDKQLAKQQR